MIKVPLIHDDSAIHSVDYFIEKFHEIGFVEGIEFPILLIRGLPSVRVGEVVLFENNRSGFVLSLSREHAVVLSIERISEQFFIGMRAARTGEPVKVPLSLDYLGQVILPMGAVLTHLFP